MGDLYKQQYDQMRALPDRVSATERKLMGLYRQAERYGMNDLLPDRDVFKQLREARDEA